MLHPASPGATPAAAASPARAAAAELGPSEQTPLPAAASASSGTTASGSEASSAASSIASSLAGIATASQASGSAHASIAAASQAGCSAAGSGACSPAHSEGLAGAATPDPQSLPAHSPSQQLPPPPQLAEQLAEAGSVDAVVRLLTANAAVANSGLLLAAATILGQLLRQAGRPPTEVEQEAFAFVREYYFSSLVIEGLQPSLQATCQLLLSSADAQLPPTERQQAALEQAAAWGLPAAEPIRLVQLMCAYTRLGMQPGWELMADMEQAAERLAYGECPSLPPPFTTATVPSVATPDKVSWAPLALVDWRGVWGPENCTRRPLPLISP